MRRCRFGVFFFVEYLDVDTIGYEVSEEDDGHMASLLVYCIVIGLSSFHLSNQSTCSSQVFPTRSDGRGN